MNWSSDFSRRPFNFHQLIRCTGHPKCSVDVLCGNIVVFNIESQSNNIAFSLRARFNVVVKPAKDTNLAMPRMDIDTLKPPEHATAPIGKFEGDHCLRDDLAIALDDKISAEVRPL